MDRAKPRRTICLLLLIFILFLFSSCGGVTATTLVGYKPPFLPVVFYIDTHGNISIQGNASITTVIGTFSLEENIAPKQQSTDATFLVIIRHKQNGSIVDTVFSIQTSQDEVSVVANGRITIDVTQHKVLIDTSRGDIHSITVSDSSSGNASVQNPFGGKLVLDDPLSDNSKGYKWDETTDYAGGACQFKDGAYHASIPQKDDEFCPAEASSFDNFALQVNMVITSGDGGGVMFRLDNTMLNNGTVTKLNCYEFLIRPNGSYVLYMYHYAGSGNKPADILSQGDSSAINTELNQSNLIAVVAHGSNITFYVNNQQVGSINNSRYSSGHIAVVADDNGNPAETIFTNAKVWKL